LVAALVQQHEEKKVAPALAATFNGLQSLFSNEKGAYDSLNRTYVSLAGSLAKYCIDQNLVDDTPVLSPALQPFKLIGHLSSAEPVSLKTAAKTQIDETGIELVSAQEKATDAMLQAITEMSTRIHELAAEGRMPSRGMPVTLTTVEKWIGAANLSSSTANTGAATPVASSGSKPASK
jgi:hypothetical protein